MIFQNNFLTLKEYARISLRYTFKTQPIFYILPLPLFSVVAYWALFPWQKFNFSSAFQGSSAFIWFLTLLFLWMPFGTWRGIRKNYESARFMQVPANYQFSDAGMDMESSVMQSHTSWEVLHRFYDFGRYGILMTGNLTGFFLDFAALQAPAKKIEFLSLLESHNIEIK